MQWSDFYRCDGAGLEASAGVSMINIGQKQFVPFKVICDYAVYYYHRLNIRININNRRKQNKD